jgi:hypothetical protein
LSLEYIRRAERKAKKTKSKSRFCHSGCKLDFLSNNGSEIFPPSHNGVKINKQKEKGKHASSTESRRIVWKYIVWPLILQTNRQYFTIHEYHRKKDEFAKINNNIKSGSPKLSGGLISLMNRGILVKNNDLYSIHYRLVPYMRKKVKLEYGLAFKEIYSKH